MKKGIGIGCLVLLLCFIGMYFVMNNEKLISKNTYLLSYFEYKDSTLKNNYYLDKKQTVGIIDGPIDVTHSEFDGVTINKKEFVSDSTEEDMRHGTSVAGLMIAQENNKGICGLLPNVNIVNAVVLQNSKAEQKKIAEAINYCVDEKVDVINISIELYRFDDILLQAIQYAEKNNVNIFMANGNGGWRKNIKNIERDWSAPLSSRQS